MEQPGRESRVVAKRGVCGGMPCVRGTRIPIAIILDTLAEGHSPESILREFPSLTMDDIRGALAYAAALTRIGTDEVAGDAQ